MEAQYERLCKERDVICHAIADTLKLLKQYQPAPRNMKNVTFSIVKDFNCSIGPNVSSTDLFDIFIAESVNHFEKADIYEILVTAGCFESKGQARKNWQGIKEIPTGYSEFGPVGKSKVHFFIWYPSE
jgi:hypothetical protein